jgi:AAHS family 3-hydroxyphenylpropionic acid transporter
LLINWLPLLLVGNGYTRPDAAFASIVLNLGGGVGAVVLGWMMDRRAETTVVVAAYAGMALSLIALSLAFRLTTAQLGVVAPASFLVGFFVIGAQLVLYGVAPSFYETSVRATGLGAAVAAGRTGSIVGPILAGQMLGSGNNAASVVTALIPVVAVAGTGALLLVLRPMPGRD